MLAYLKGTVIAQSECTVVFLAGNVGYELITAATFPVKQDHIWVWEVVTQDTHRMFGFSTIGQRQIALKLTRLDGIGPTLAARVAQAFDIDEVKKVLVSKDAKQLAKLVKGLGHTRANAIVEALSEQMADEDSRLNDDIVYLAVATLEGLGHKDVRDLVKRVVALPTAPASVQDVVRDTLLLIATKG